jgi:hypothetical protein
MTINFNGFSQICDEFGFEQLKVKPSEFCPSIGPKEAKEAKDAKA